MTESEVIDAAREAGLLIGLNNVSWESIRTEEIYRFAAIIEAKTREQDARICERLLKDKNGPKDSLHAGQIIAASILANAIRGQE